MAAGESPRPDADSPTVSAKMQADFLDPLLTALLKAQSAWLASRDPAALRKELIAILSMLG
jgi:hypothetical protein